MTTFRGQGELLPGQSLSNPSEKSSSIKLSRSCLENWQQRIYNHQEKLFEGKANHQKQVSLFPNTENESTESFNPLRLTPLAMSFWRWPSIPHKGPAIYLVMDKPQSIDGHLLLYVGETIAADRRWKGEHDCKRYLSAYSEALAGAKVSKRLSIRFWTDVPTVTRARRNIEQQLIRLWLPPFNKETRAHWATPFTAEDF